MAGGIFSDQPFYFNPKCIVISLILMIAYWTLPYRNPFMLPVIFVVGYVAIAWYDYLYNCDSKMYSGTFPISIATLDSWAKPQRRKETIPDNPNNLLLDQEMAYKKKIHALHVIAIAPILFYIGWYGAKSNKNIWAVVGSIAFLTILYHGLRIIYPREVTNCDANDNDERGYLLSIYIFHLLAIFPILGYVALKGKKSDNRVWGSALGLSVLTFAYHLFRYFYPRRVKQCG